MPIPGMRVALHTIVAVLSIGLLAQARDGGGSAGAVAAAVDPPVRIRSLLGNYALHFNGGTNGITIPSAAVLNPEQAMTLECWVKFDRVDVGQWIVLKDNGTTMRQYALGMPYPAVLHGDSRFRPHVGTAARYAWFDSVDTIVEADTWYHVAQTYDGSTLRLYVNGVPDGAQPVNSPMVTYPVPLTMSINPELTPLYGVLDEVKLWDVALSASQIRRSMRRRFRFGAPSSLVGYWPFDDGVGDVARDYSGFGNHGMLGGAFGPDAGDPTWTTDTAPVR